MNWGNLIITALCGLAVGLLSEFIFGRGTWAALAVCILGSIVAGIICAHVVPIL